MLWYARVSDQSQANCLKDQTQLISVKINNKHENNEESAHSLGLFKLLIDNS